MPKLGLLRVSSCSLCLKLAEKWHYGINFYLRVLMTELEAENYAARKPLDCLWSNFKTYSWDGLF